MKKIITITAVGLVALSLAACNKGPDANMSHASNATDAKTYAVPGQASYRGNQRAYFKNPMRAAANQVYYFGFDSSRMRPQDLRALQVQANYLASHPNARIRLEGNTDNRGSREYNIGLGWRRDQTVTRLLEQQGVRPNQIQMVSYGKEHPVLVGSSENAWALNRRVNLIYKASS